MVDCPPTSFFSLVFADSSNLQILRPNSHVQLRFRTSLLDGPGGPVPTLTFCDSMKFPLNLFKNLLMVVQAD